VKAIRWKLESLVGRDQNAVRTTSAKRTLGRVDREATGPAIAAGGGKLINDLEMLLLHPLQDADPSLRAAV
jgi:hypothetical protein